MAQVLDYDHLAWARQCMLGQIWREAVDEKREGGEAREQEKERTKDPQISFKDMPSIT